MNRIVLTDEQIQTLKRVRSKHRAKEAEKMLGFPVSRQRIEYHLKTFEPTPVPSTAKGKKEHYRGLESTLRATRQDEHKSDRTATEELEYKEHDRVVIVSDVHAPYNHKDLLSFHSDLKKLVNPDLVICTGDELDNHAISFHTSDPDLDSAGIELQKGREVLQALAGIYPEMYLPHSNHGDLPYRKAKAHGLSKHLILSYKDIIFAQRDTEGSIVPNTKVNWYWSDKIIFNTPLGKVKVVHGQDTVDVIKSIKDNSISMIRGHWHSRLNIEYVATHSDLKFGMTVGCGVDEDSYAFAYNKVFNAKFIVSAGLVINGIPKVVPMPMDDEGNYLGKESLERIVGRI